MSEARSRRASGTPRCEPMRGCEAPGSHHRTFGDFLGAAGGQKKIAHVAGGKNEVFWFIEPVGELGGQRAARKRCAASSVLSKTPLFAYARSSLRPRSANCIERRIISVSRFCACQGRDQRWLQYVTRKSEIDETPLA